MNSHVKAIKRLSSAVLLASIAACGGGGGGDSSTPATPPVASVPSTPTAPTTPTTPTAPTTPTVPTTPPPVTMTEIFGPLLTSIPTPTYAAGSVELTVFDTVNKARANCGVGLQAQNAQLDLAASKHAEYVRLRWEEGSTSVGHTEDPLKSGYYATTGADRAVKAGYAGGSGGENLSFAYVNSGSNTGDRLARHLLGSVYHLRGLFDKETEVGLAVSVANQPGLPPLASLAWQPGYAPKTNQASTTDVLTYPCEGSSGVKTTFDGESPDPFAGVNMGVYTSLGHPIYVFSPKNAPMIVNSATLTSAAGVSIPAYVYTSAVDPQKLVRSSESFVVPLTALNVSTKYTVQITGTVDGAAFAKAFQFTTGTY